MLFYTMSLCPSRGLMEGNFMNEKIMLESIVFVLAKEDDR